LFYTWRRDTDIGSYFRDVASVVEAFMAESKEMRRLTAKWDTGAGWPKRLEWVQIDGLRGWRNEKFTLNYPIMAVVGENGSGKSTLLQCIAAVYISKPPKRQGRKWQARKPTFASDFFPDTTWEKVKNATIRYSVRQGINNPPQEGSMRKPGPRWRGNTERPERQVVYIDLSRIQPILSRVGYYRLANPQWTEESAIPFEKHNMSRFGHIMGREYQTAKMAYTNADEYRPVPVLGHSGNTYSGFHQGAGEIILAELLQVEIPPTSIVLIDEIESSLHPRLQRRLIRDLAELARTLDLQIIISTHSPFVLDELPAEARAQIIQAPTERTIVYGVTPEFAMSKMDDVQQFECDLYVEDARAERMLIEVIVAHSSNPESILRCRTIKYGAASVGQALGIMAVQNRFPRPSFIFLDADQGSAAGCVNLPGEEAPERVVFEALRARSWLNVHERIKREFSEVADACTQAMFLPEHHEWLRYAANKLVIGGDTLWQVMCSEWATNCIDADQVKYIVQPVEDALNRILRTFTPPQVMASVRQMDSPPPQPISKDYQSDESLLLFGKEDQKAIKE
jgi:predicted ATPase